MFDLLLVVHIITGALGLTIGLVVMLTQKGKLKHKRLGSFFFVFLLSSSLCALVMSAMRGGQFLFVVAVFTIYMLLTGKRALLLKNASDVRIYDWCLTVVMFLFALSFAYMGIQLSLNRQYFGLVMIVFGIISLLFVRADWVHYKGNSPYRNAGVLIHIQRMVSSYIASATAFLVVNNTFLPPTVAWLLPTAVLTPLIVFWSRKRALYKVNKGN